MLKIDDDSIVFDRDVPVAGVDTCKAIFGFLEMVTDLYDKQMAYRLFAKVLENSLEIFEWLQSRKGKESG